jgi:hypothetical protein
LGNAFTSQDEQDLMKELDELVGVSEQIPAAPTEQLPEGKIFGTAIGHRLIKCNYYLTVVTEIAEDQTIAKKTKEEVPVRQKVLA